MSVMSSSSPSPSSSSNSSDSLDYSSRLIAATAGSLITSILVTPFDVIKTRIQTQQRETVSHSHSSSSFCSHHVQLQRGLDDVWCHRCKVEGPHGTTPSLSVTPRRFTSSTDAFIKLIKHEGITALWRGLSPTLIHSVPNTVIYFVGYDTLRVKLNVLYPNSPYSPLLCGVFSRALSTIIVSPIELIKTKSQSLTSPKSAIAIASEEFKRGGITALWRGASPTLWRDVPFSAVYWGLYEKFKKILTERKAVGGIGGLSISPSPFGISFVCGASSGLIAAMLTHPMDIVKTRRQIEIFQFTQNSSNQMTMPSHSTMDTLKSIIRQEGLKGLTTGMTARLGKIVPACAVMISTYEFAKRKLGAEKQ